MYLVTSMHSRYRYLPACYVIFYVPILHAAGIIIPTRLLEQYIYTSIYNIYTYNITRTVDARANYYYLSSAYIPTNIAVGICIYLLGNTRPITRDLQYIDT